MNGHPTLTAHPSAACDDVTRSEIVVPVFGYNYHNEPDATTRDPEHRKVRTRSSRASSRVCTPPHARVFIGEERTHSTIAGILVCAAHRGAGH
ncbi:hypothetical protein EON67_00725 [archaeon]|nr:MAG: hypothetical protein EON67_00725 [archaeon]